MLRRMVAYAFIQAIAFTCAGLAEAFSSLKSSLDQLINNPIDAPADSCYGFYAVLPEKVRGFCSHSSGNNAIDTSFMEELR